MKRAYIQLHISLLLGGFTGLFGKLISFNEGLLVWYRLLFSFCLLWCYQQFTRKHRQLPWRQSVRIWFAGVLLALFWLFFYGSIKYANISIGVVCFSTVGFFTAILAPVINRRRIAANELLLSSLTICGILLIFHFDSQYRLGIILGIICAVFGALFTIANERLIRQYESLCILYHEMTGGLICASVLLPVYLHKGTVYSMIPSCTDISYLLILSSFCTIGMYGLMTQALDRLSAFTVSLSCNLEPVYSILLAIVFFGENNQLTIAFYTGLTLILLSVLLQLWYEIRRRRQ
jgi:drug/metabolite transporter (DMT)-like permease